MARAELDDDAEPTALDYTAHWIANGGTLIRLAAKLQEASQSAAQGPYEPLLQGETIGRMLRRTFGDQVVDARFALARARGAHALVESTHEIADESVTSSEDASRARNRIGTRQWAASAYERNTFGQRGNQVNVAINLGQLHLDALRHRAVQQGETTLPDGQVRALPAPTVDAVGIEYDDVRDDTPTT
jgi:hypothetical protein